MNAPLPANEPERLAALHNYAILDTMPEAAFERLTRMATQLFHVPIAFVSLMDADRQWFKSCHGLDTLEWGRDIAFCAYTILSHGIMVVPDATQDPRFADNLLVTGPPHIRFYAGAPLTSPEGYNLGTLAVLDTTPREFSQEESATLSDLALQVMDGILLRQAGIELRNENMERKRAEQVLKDNQERLQLALESAHIGTFDWNLRTGEAVWSESYERLHGLLPGTFNGTSEAGFAMVHPDDRESIEQAAARVLAEGVRYDIEFRVIWPDGSLHWISGSGQAYRDETGQPVRLIGMGHDITVRKLGEAVLVERVRLSTLAADVSATFTRGNGLREGLQGCAAALVRHLDAAFARIWTLNEADNMLELQASAGLYTHLDGLHSRVPVGHLKIGLIAQEKQPHLTNKVIGDPRVNNQEWARREGMVAFAGYPLILEDRVIGVMALFARHPLTDDTLEALRSVAQEIASGISRKRAEEALHEQKELLQTIFDHIPVMISFSDSNGRIRMVNREWEHVLGWSLEQAQNHPNIMAEFYPDQKDLERVLNLMRGSNGEWADFKTKIRDGRILDTSWTNVQLSDGTRIGMGQDITARKQAEDQLRVSRERLQAILDNTTAVIYLVDVNSRFLLVNRQFETRFQVSNEQVAGKSIHDFFTKEIAGAFHANNQKVIEAGVPMECEEIVPQDDGVHTYLSTKVLLYDSAGVAYAICGISTDITDRKQAEAALYESEARFRAFMDNSPAVAFIKDEAGRYQYINKLAELQLGGDKWLGRTDYEFLEEEVASELRQHDEIVLAADKTLEIEETLPHPDGQPHDWMVLKFPFRDASGQRFLGGMAVDITERKQVDQALQTSKEEAERANRAKSEFMSRMSHELRTPMNAILGFSQLLEMDDLEVQQQAGVEQILKAGRHLLKLIDEVLDIARIESEQPLLDIEPVPIVEALTGALDLVRPLATPHNIELRGEWDAAAGLSILADRRRLNQVLLNLLSNAVKYNRDGGTVTLSCTIDAIEEQHLSIAVSDSGMGIAPEKMTQLFIPFSRLGAEQTSIEGTGLGLALSKRLVEAMGGIITARSAPGEGSTFEVTLPRSIQEKPQSAAGAAAMHEPLAREGETQAVVLYIEDNLSNFGLVQNILRHRPEIKLLAAMQGWLGIELAVEHNPDLILLDVHLPDIDGHEVLQRLRAEPDTRTIPVVVVSADATPHQIERLRAAGANDYLTKPLDVKRFLEVLDEKLRDRPIKGPDR